MIPKSEVPLKAPGIEKRLISHIPESRGTLTDRGGRTVPVNVSLTEWRLYIDEVPASRSAEGHVEFFNLADAFDLRDVQEGLTLQCGQMQAEVSMLSLRSFTVVGGCLQGAANVGHHASRPAELIHG